MGFFEYTCSTIYDIGGAGHVRERLDEGVVSTEPLKTAGGIQQTNFVKESSLYNLLYQQYSGQFV